MAYVFPTIITQGMEGADLGAISQTYTQTSASSSTNSPDYPGYPFTLGTRVVASNGSEWIFGTTAGTIAQYQTVIINSSWSATLVGGAGAATAVPEAGAGFIGFWQNATSLTSGLAGWFMISGSPTVLVASAGVTVPLYTSDTAGALTGATNTVSHYQISGITCVVTASGSTASATLTVANSVSVRKPLAGS